MATTMSLEACSSPLEALLEVIEYYNIVVYSLVSSCQNYYNPDPEPCFPELASSLTEFVTNVLGFMDISCSLADIVIKAVQSLTSRSSESIKIHPRDDVLHAIEDTMGAYREMRVADNEVLRKCMELPLEVVKAALAEATNQGKVRDELYKFKSYPASLSTRNALPIEDCLVRLKTWWKANHYESLRSMSPLAPDTELYGRLISECDGFIALVGICARLWFKPLGPHLRIFSHPLLKSIDVDGVLSRKHNYLVDMTTWYIERGHMSYGEFILAFNRDVLSAAAYFAEPLHTAPSHLFNEVMRSYTKLLGFTYELVALRFKLDVHITWHIPAVLLLRDSTEALHPVCDLHESLGNARDKATTEIEYFRNLASKLEELCPSHGNSLYPVTDETPEHLKCINCLIHNLIEHATFIKREILQHACYSSQSQNHLGTAQPSHMSLSRLAEKLLAHGRRKEEMKKRFTFSGWSSTPSLISDIRQIVEKIQSDPEFQNILGHINMLDLLWHEVDGLSSVPGRLIEILTTSTTPDIPWFQPNQLSSVPGRSIERLQVLPAPEFHPNQWRYLNMLSLPTLHARGDFQWRRCSSKEQIVFSQACAAAKRGESSKSKKDDLQKKSNDLSNKQSWTKKSFSGNWDF